MKLESNEVATSTEETLPNKDVKSKLAVQIIWQRENSQSVTSRLADKVMPIEL